MRACWREFRRGRAAPGLRGRCRRFSSRGRRSQIGIDGTRSRSFWAAQDDELGWAPAAGRRAGGASRRHVGFGGRPELRRRPRGSAPARDGRGGRGRPRAAGMFSALGAGAPPCGGRLGDYLCIGTFPPFAAFHGMPPSAPSLQHRATGIGSPPVPTCSAPRRSHPTCTAHQNSAHLRSRNCKRHFTMTLRTSRGVLLLWAGKVKSSKSKVQVQK